MAEMRVWAWANWVKKHKKSWYDAGVLARERMAERVTPPLSGTSGP
jgi:hypothetical protein